MYVKFVDMNITRPTVIQSMELLPEQNLLISLLTSNVHYAELAKMSLKYRNN